MACSYGSSPHSLTIAGVVVDRFLPRTSICSRFKLRNERQMPCLEFNSSPTQYRKCAPRSEKYRNVLACCAELVLLAPFSKCNTRLVTGLRVITVIPVRSASVMPCGCPEAIAAGVGVWIAGPRLPTTLAFVQCHPERPQHLRVSIQ